MFHVLPRSRFEEDARLLPAGPGYVYHPCLPPATALAKLPLYLKLSRSGRPPLLFPLNPGQLLPGYNPTNCLFRDGPMGWLAAYAVLLLFLSTFQTCVLGDSLFPPVGIRLYVFVEGTEVSRLPDTTRPLNKPP